MGRPLFPAPGVYTLSMNWRMTRDGRHEQVELVQINVESPPETDKAIIEMLKEDRCLANAMISPFNVPDGEAVERLKRIVKDHPQSSYSDYARFAIARALLRGVNPQYAYPADQITKQVDLLASSSTTLEKFRAALHDRFFDSWPLRCKADEVVNAVVNAKGGDKETYRAAVANLVRLVEATREDRVEAIKWLDQIRSKDFAFCANALVAKLGALLVTDPSGAKPVVEELDRDCRDCQEWLEIKEKRVHDDKEWAEFRLIPAEAAAHK